MSEDSMLKCLIFFVLGFLVARMMRGNGLMVGGKDNVERALDQEIRDHLEYPNNKVLLGIDREKVKYEKHKQRRRRRQKKQNEQNERQHRKQDLLRSESVCPADSIPSEDGEYCTSMPGYCVGKDPLLKGKYMTGLANEDKCKNYCSVNPSCEGYTWSPSRPYIDDQHAALSSYCYQYGQGIADGLPGIEDFTKVGDNTWIISPGYYQPIIKADGRTEFGAKCVVKQKQLD